MSPSIVLGLLLGSLYGFLWHAWFGRRPLGLLGHWLVALGGFFAGYLLAAFMRWHLVLLGAIPLVEATAGAFLALLAVWWLSRRRTVRSVAPAT
jgi:uncharacterized membrane protein YeaQ/YmgE (transglycosylase-associated protein family)